jgi:hypothetical protein
MKTVNNSSPVNKRWKERRCNESLEYPLIILANEFIKKRRESNNRTRIVWIPAHLNKKHDKKKSNNIKNRIAQDT